MVRTGSLILPIHDLLVEFAKQLTHCWHGLRIELCYFTRIDRDTDST